MEISAPKKITWTIALHIGIIGILAQFVKIDGLPDLQPFAIWIILAALVLILAGCLVKPL